MNPEEKELNYKLGAKLLSEQDFPKAILFGVVATAVSAIIIEMQIYDVYLADLIVQLTPSLIIELLFAGAQWVDMLFWMFAIGAAVYFAKRKLSREEGLAIYTLRRRPKQSGPID